MEVQFFAYIIEQNACNIKVENAEVADSEFTAKRNQHMSAHLFAQGT
jgi:hypothetical protein